MNQGRWRKRSQCIPKNHSKTCLKFEMMGGGGYWQNKQWPFNYNLTGYLPELMFMSLHLSCQISDSDRCCHHLKSNVSYSSLSTYSCHMYIHLYCILYKSSLETFLLLGCVLLEDYPFSEKYCYFTHTRMFQGA